MTDLSVIILSYNTAPVTMRCLEALFTSLKGSNLGTEVIVVDNASKDDSVEMLKGLKVRTALPKNIEFKILVNKQNLGFSGGNNFALRNAEGKYVLFLNSDAIVESVDFDNLVSYMDEHPSVGVLTVKVVLPTGAIDPASHRGFPTPWNSFAYYSGLEKLLGKVPRMGKYVGGYHLTHLNLNTVHEIDSPTGAFYLTRGSLMKELGGFDDVNFFMYGEDLDLSYRIKEKGYSVVYYPTYTVTHLKYTSGLQKKDPETQARTMEYFYDAMKKFYTKHYEEKYPSLLTKAIYFVIDLKKRLS